MQSTIKNHEINKFAELAEEWWSTTGPFAPLHKLNPTRIEYITKIIEKNNSSKKDKINILDVGCGGGIITYPLAKIGYKLTAIDAHEKNINIAKNYNDPYYKSVKEENITFITSTIEDLSKNIDKKFDVIISLEVIEHVDNVELFLLSMLKYLKPNGIIILSTLNRTVKSVLLAKIAAEYILNMVPKGTHDPKYFVKPQEIKNIFKDKISLIDEKGMSFNPLKNQWSLTDNLDVNYFVSFKDKN